jgi:beta-phosphoglucomutase-like phosphatase (HAD superfamily)
LLAVHGAVEAVSQIHTLYQGRIACASGADRFKVELQLKKCGLMPFFEGPHLQRPRAAALQALPRRLPRRRRGLGVDPKRCAVVEDTVTGATAGVAAGCTVFGFSPPELGHDAPNALRPAARPMSLPTWPTWRLYCVDGLKIIFPGMSIPAHPVRRKVSAP